MILWYYLHEIMLQLTNYTIEIPLSMTILKWKDVWYLKRVKKLFYEAKSSGDELHKQTLIIQKLIESLFVCSCLHIDTNYHHQEQTQEADTGSSHLDLEAQTIIINARKNNYGHSKYIWTVRSMYDIVNKDIGPWHLTDFFRCCSKVNFIYNINR